MFPIQEPPRLLGLNSDGRCLLLKLWIKTWWGGGRFENWMSTGEIPSRDGCCQMGQHYSWWGRLQRNKLTKLRICILRIAGYILSSLLKNKLWFDSLSHFLRLSNGSANENFQYFFGVGLQPWPCPIESVNHVPDIKLNPNSVSGCSDLISMGFRGADRPCYWYSHRDFGRDIGSHDEIRRWEIKPAEQNVLGNSCSQFAWN